MRGRKCQASGGICVTKSCVILYSSPNIIWVIKSTRNMQWGREVCVGFWTANLVERNHLEVLSVDGRIILKVSLDQDEKVWTGFIWLKQGQVADCFERDKENLSFIQFGKFSLQLTKGKLLQQDCCMEFEVRRVVTDIVAMCVIVTNVTLICSGRSSHELCI